MHTSRKVSSTDDSIPVIELTEEQSESLFVRAIEHGAYLRGDHCAEWLINGPCTDPVGLLLQGRSDRDVRNFPNLGKRGKWLREDVYAERTTRSKAVRMLVPCRKCDQCQKYRRWLWQSRMQAEWNYSVATNSRVWFWTLTYREPKYLSMMSEAVAAGYQSRSLVMSDGPDTIRSVRDANLVKTISGHWNLFTSRMRKMGYDFRFVRVLEKTKADRFHVHALAFEAPSAERLLSVRIVDRCWAHGFTKSKLARELPAQYLTKYLVKGGSSVPIFASRYFGNPGSNPLERASTP